MTLLETLEKQCILDVILETGCMSIAAKRLGIGRSTIYRKLKSYGISGDLMIAEIAHKNLLATMDELEYLRSSQYLVLEGLREENKMLKQMTKGKTAYAGE